MSVERAIESFVKGFCFTRSFTHPFVASREQGLWVMRDGPGRREPRTSEIVSYCRAASDVLRLGQEIEGRWALCAIADPGEEKDLAGSFKALGFSLRLTEPFFIADTHGVIGPSDQTVRRVLDQSEADRIKAASRRREILPEHLGIDDAPLRLYAAWQGNEPVGWVKSIRTHPDTAWVSNLFVAKPHRRQGLGTSLMRAMLCDDSRLGIATSVLLASHTGALLYPKLGYRRVGTLLVMSPRKR